MLILVGFERFGRVRDVLRAKGHEAYSCDILPDAGETDGPVPRTGGRYHLQCNILDALFNQPRPWDMGIFFPVCTDVCSSGLWRCNHDPARAVRRDAAMQTFRVLDELPTRHWRTAIPKIAIENPIGALSRIRKPDQIIQPYMFGEDASKATCIWVRGVPPLDIPPRCCWAQPRVVNGKNRWSNQTDSGQNRLGPGPNRAAERGKTYWGVALAMGNQWG